MNLSVPLGAIIGSRWLYRRRHDRTDRGSRRSHPARPLFGTLDDPDRSKSFRLVRYNHLDGGQAEAQSA